MFFIQQGLLKNILKKKQQVRDRGSGRNSSFQAVGDTSIACTAGFIWSHGGSTAFTCEEDRSEAAEFEEWACFYSREIKISFEVARMWLVTRGQLITTIFTGDHSK